MAVLEPSMYRLVTFFFLVGIKDKNNARDTNYFTKIFTNC